MRHLIITIVLLSFISTVSISQTKDGFRGYKWGTSIAIMQDKFNLSNDYNNVPKSNTGYEVYNTNIDNIDGNPAKVFYGYFHDKFCAVTIRMEKRYSLMLLMICTDLYGKNYIAYTPESATWTPKNSKRVGSNTCVKLLHGLENSDAILMIECISMKNEIDKAYEKESEINRKRLEKEF